MQRVIVKRNRLGQFVRGTSKIGGVKKGDKLSQETRLKIGNAQRGLFGPASHRWKGANASYQAKHQWIATHYGKANRCELNKKHKSPVYHWANVSGEYKRERTDWIRLCPSCNVLAALRKWNLTKMLCKTVS